MPIFSSIDDHLPRIDAQSVRWSLRIPMRDGVELNGLVFRPAATSLGGARAPAVVQLTPYGLDSFYPLGRSFTERQLCLVLVDSRGRGDSDGEFDVLEVDATDASDVVDWVARQSWCDGQVGMYGGSYSATNQWTAAKSLHPALRTITPWGASYPGIDLGMGGVPYVGHVGWHGLTFGRDTHWGLGSDSTLWAEMLARAYRENRQVWDLATENGPLRPAFRRALTDPFHAIREMTFLPREEELCQMSIPILSSTGHFDSTHPGTLYHFQRFEQFASEDARRNHYLIIGPWNHAGMNGASSVGDLQFAEAARLDLHQLRLDWLRWAFGMGEKPRFLTHRIMYYLQGAEEWRGCDTLEEACSRRRNFYLRSDGDASDIFHSGYLTEDASDSPPDRYVSDPFDTEIIKIELVPRSIPRPQKEGTSIQYPERLRGLHWQLFGEDPTDAAFCHHLRGQGVVYHSAQMSSPLNIVGMPQLKLWVTLDATDTDIVALLYEVLPDDGTSILLWSDIIRVRYRESRLAPKLADPGRPICVEFLTPRFVSRRLSQGSRLRLVIRAPASIHYQKNLHSGKPVHEEQPADARVCTVLLHHDRHHQTVLRLPVLDDVRVSTP